ncbi:MAG: hypothetical protein RIS52_1367 [Pseudomonadota bacterium]
MIAPTRTATLLIAAGAPAALLIGVLFPHVWTVGLAWVLFILALCVIDFLLSAPGGRLDIELLAPASVCVGERYDVALKVRFPSRTRLRGPRVALAVNALIDPGLPLRAPLLIEGGTGQAILTLSPLRRGLAQVTEIWVRWQGPLGLIAQQRRIAEECETIITPDIRPVRTEGVRLFQRDAVHGLIAQLERGEGTEFEALADFQAGMDKRSIDWKQSARHHHLLAKEYRTERDNRIVFAIDCGRAMSEPLSGVPRVDRAITAALLTAWAALKLGDRASLYAFDSRPQLHSGAMTGVENFAQLQKLAAGIDYSSQETNHTLALSSLAQQLTRRSLIILFTDFTDPTSADLLVRAVGWLLERHAVLFVVMRDADLAAMIEAEPADAAAVARAVTAAALINEQRKVTARLRRLGLDVIEASHDAIGLRLINAYLSLKQRGRL